MELRAVTRTIIYNPKDQKVLLAKNVGQNFWYPPGGGWEYRTGESIIDCAQREVFEETGINVEIQKFLYAQQYQYKNKHIQIETFWLAFPTNLQEFNSNHQDLDKNGSVETVRWFSKEEILGLEIFPSQLRNTFWKDLNTYLSEDNRFLEIVNKSNCQSNENTRLRVVARAIIHNPENDKILMVNDNDHYWYLPGGGWEFNNENIVECLNREVLEETGLKVRPKSLIYLQQFQEKTDTIQLELYWLAVPLNIENFNENHKDTSAYKPINKIKWLSKEDLKSLLVYPQELKNSFWENLNNYMAEENRFLGIQKEE